MGTNYSYAHFTTISGHLFTNHIDIFPKIGIQTVILKSFTCLKLTFFKKKCFLTCFDTIFKRRAENLFPINGHFKNSLPFFCQLHICLSQNWGSDDHFEVLNVSRFELDQRILYIIGYFSCHKMYHFRNFWDSDF